MIEAGKLKHRLQFESFTYAAQTDYGTPPKVWSVWKTVWGEITPVSAKESILAMQFSPEVSHKVKVRYRAGFSPLMRIRYAGRLFAIEGIVDDEERHESMTIWCSEPVNANMTISDVAQVGYDGLGESDYNNLGE